jgi:hypothetical protein
MLNTARLFVSVSQVTAFLMAAGWIAVVYTATFMRGGHPPLSGVVGIVVIMASWILGTVGVLAGLVCLTRPGLVSRKVAILFVCLNAGLLAFSVLVNFM